MRPRAIHRPAAAFVKMATMLACGLVAGCKVGPDYAPPPIDAPERFRFAETETREVANPLWWQQFEDPALDELIRIALTDNFDVRIAAARVEEFYGVLRVTRSGLFPQVGAEFVVGREFVPPAEASDTVRADAFAAWEIDLFGRLRRLSEASRADLLASEEGRRFAVLTLTSTVASTYLTLRTLDAQLDIARRTLTSRESALRIFQARHRRGAISEIELSQARSEHALALATIPPLEQASAQVENALAVLLGRNPGPIPRGKTIEELTLPAVPAGLPSEILERRPDLRAAELNLVSANARIGAAKALYYPRISLTGLFGAASTSISALFDDPQEIWTYGAGVAAPVFTGGGVAGQVDIAEARQEQALLAYQKAIRVAFQEVEDALIAGQKSREGLAAQTQRVDALRRYAHLANLRFDNGYSGYLEVLDAERSLFNAELEYTRQKSETQQALVNLYKAMGGGWVVEASGMAPQPDVNLAKNPRPYP